MPSKTRLIEDVPEITFEKGMFRVHYDSGRVDAYSPHVFMVGVRAAQTAIEAWFASGQSEPLAFKSKACGGEH